MNELKEIYELLDLIDRPGFFAKEGRIVKLNQAAQGLFLSPGNDIDPLLSTGAEDYAAFRGGCRYLQLTVAGQARGASVTRVEDLDLFLLEQETDAVELHAMALAAKELRNPLSSMIAIVDNLLPKSLPEGDEKIGELLARMSKSLYQMQRILGNMSDAGGWSSLSHQQIRNIPRVFGEIFEKAAALLCCSGIQICYQGIQEPILGLIDDQQMERAVWNILSNAAKFMPDGGVIHATLTQQGRYLHLSVQDSGTGIAQNVLSSVFTRYMRPLTLEDPRFGIGLGMVLVQTAAIAHGGAVLIDQPSPTGTRVTITMKIDQSGTPQFHSLVTDLSGGRDAALIELSDCLPLSAYQNEL